MVTSPEHQMVSSSNSASFNCTARGSSIEIIWQYNGNSYTMADSNTIITVKNKRASEVNGNVSADIVCSTLMVRSVTISSSVSCVVRQRFDGSIDPDFNNALFVNGFPDNEMAFSALLISKSRLILLYYMLTKTFLEGSMGLKEALKVVKQRTRSGLKISTHIDSHDSGYLGMAVQLRMYKLIWDITIS